MPEKKWKEAVVNMRKRLFKEKFTSAREGHSHLVEKVEEIFSLIKEPYPGGWEYMPGIDQKLVEVAAICEKFYDDIFEKHSIGPIL